MLSSSPGGYSDSMEFLSAGTLGPLVAGMAFATTGQWALFALAALTARVGAQAGAPELGASVYELEPGAVGSPRCVQHANVVTPRASRIDALRTAPGDSRGSDSPY